MSAVLKDNDVINAIKGMDGWNYDDVYRCAIIANEMGHYPEILIYKKGSVRITATTHDEGGITDNDVALIESVEILVS